MTYREVYKMVKKAAGYNIPNTAELGKSLVQGGALGNVVPSYGQATGLYSPKQGRAVGSGLGTALSRLQGYVPQTAVGAAAKRAPRKTPGMAGVLSTPRQGFHNSPIGQRATGLEAYADMLPNFRR